MLSLLLEVFTSFTMARSFPRAVEAIATDATSQPAMRLRSVAVGSLLAAAVFLVTAALLWSPIQPSTFANICGWTGVLLLEAFVIVGNRCYKEIQLD